MKNSEDQLLSENIKQLLKGNLETPPYSNTLESMIMDSIEPAVNHAAIIARNRRLSKLGFRVCIGLVILLSGIVIKESIQANSVNIDRTPMHFLFLTLFSVIALFTLFIQLEWRGSTRF